jgi:hypothetical protein
MKTHRSDLAMARKLKMFRQLKRVFKPYRMMSKELKGGGGRWDRSHHNVSAKKIKIQKIPNHCFQEGGKLFANFLFSRGSLNLASAKMEE